MKRRSRIGFTLLELLIALSLFSVIMVVVSSVFSTGILAWRRAEGESEQYQEIRLTFDRMGVELRNTIPFQGIPFEGKEDRLSFLQVRSSRSPSSSPEWMVVTYEVKQTPQAVSLVRRAKFLLNEKETEDVVLSPLSGVRFSYPSFDEKGKWDWKESWDPGALKKSIPPFLKMALSVREGEKWEKLFLIPILIPTEVGEAVSQGGSETDEE
ncbi:MAG: prepilin-type N-terminal cleavage/methylation domain-containing protein [Candidatus Omnitrophica bacterium]|nr:prepilin-type N-terminal cleavage/methylation domain-containing protein [Candidatus Omnitrophota bacterium]